MMQYGAFQGVPSPSWWEPDTAYNPLDIINTNRATGGVHIQNAAVVNKQRDIFVKDADMTFMNTFGSASNVTHIDENATNTLIDNGASAFLRWTLSIAQLFENIVDGLGNSFRRDVGVIQEAKQMSDAVGNLSASQMFANQITDTVQDVTGHFSQRNMGPGFYDLEVFASPKLSFKNQTPVAQSNHVRDTATLNSGSHSIGELFVQSSVEDGATGDNVSRVTNSSSAVDGVTNVALGKTSVFLQDINKWNFAHGGATVFGINNDGKIKTNQSAAPGIHPTLSFEIPVYDETGSLLGFIPVFT